MPAIEDPQTLDKLVRQYEQACQALRANPIYLAYRVKADGLEDRQAYAKMHPQQSELTQDDLAIAKWKDEVRELRKRAETDPIARQLTKARNALEDQLFDLWAREYNQVSHLLSSAKSIADTSAALVKSAKQAYRDTKQRAEESWNSTARASVPRKLKAFEDAREQKLSADNRVASLRSEREWLDRLHLRIKAAQEPLAFLPFPDAMRPGHPSMLVRGDTRGLNKDRHPVLKNDRTRRSAERELGKTMGLRAARRYWGGQS